MVLPVQIIPALLLPNGSAGQVLQTDGLGNVAWADIAAASITPGAPNTFLKTVVGVATWVTFGLPDIPVGVPGQQLFAAPITGQATWAAPLGHSEEIAISAGTLNSEETTPVGQSVINFDPSTLVAASGGLTRTIRLQVVLWATTGMTAEVLLYNLTDGAVVAGTTLTTANTRPTFFETADLPVPGTLPNAARVYELRLRISAGVPGPTSRAFVSQARFVARWS